MSVPGSNLLALALSIQGVQPVQWYKNTGRTVNVVGKFVAVYDDPVTVYGSFQPMSRAQKQYSGYDLQKSMATFYASKPMQPMGRDMSGDQLAYAGSRWQLTDDVDWFAQDGWDQVDVIRVGPDV